MLSKRTLKADWRPQQPAAAPFAPVEQDDIDIIAGELRVMWRAEERAKPPPAGPSPPISYDAMLAGLRDATYGVSKRQPFLTDGAADGAAQGSGE